MSTQQLTNLRVTNKMVLPMNTNLATINGQSLIELRESVDIVTGCGFGKYALKSASYTITALDYTIDNDTAGVTTTLLTAVGIVGQIFNIANSSGGTITIDTTSSQTIYMPHGAVTSVVLNDGESLTVQSTGANWRSL